jgi:hypothetical protein
LEATIITKNRNKIKFRYIGNRKKVIKGQGRRNPSSSKVRR